jgi:hypothetical protein
MPVVTKQQSKPTAASKNDNVLDRIAPVVEVSDTRILINIFGRNGTGKTTCACTFPKPLLLLGFEDGTKSIVKVKGVDFVLLQHTDEVHDVVAMLRKGSKYATLVVDTVTSMQDMILKELMGLDDPMVQIGWGTVSRDQYRARSEKSKALMYKFLTVPCNVVLLAQEKNHTENDEEGGGEVGSDMLKPFVAASLGKSAAGWLCQSVDYICQTFVREETVKTLTKIGDKQVETHKKTGKPQFCLRTQKGNPIYASKMRMDKMIDPPEYITNPDYDKIMQVVAGTYKS